MRSYFATALIAAQLLPSQAHGWYGGSGGPAQWGQPHGQGRSCSALTAADVRAAGNNSLFTRWRPYSHFNAPSGWQNDPCGPLYDPVRRVYHLSYQWHPQHINWGNISWGSAISHDLVTWTDLGLALGPTGYGNYNGLGIFSGTAQPVNLQGQQDGTLLAFYTSVAHLPTSYSIPYTPYTETQALALSHDGGKSWEYYGDGPVINATTNEAPMYWNLTGFRDPFFFADTTLDKLLEQSEPHYYAVFGSGIKGVGPRMPLWTAPSSDLTKWTFLGSLFEPAANTTLASALTTGSYGYNFEVSSFYSLKDSSGTEHWFIGMGSEGGNVSFHESSHWALWNEGTLSKRNNQSVEFSPVSGGAADWGLAYAVTSFNDTKTTPSRRIEWTWAPEDITGDDGLFSTVQQGFQGSLTIPREVFVHEADHLSDPQGTLASSKQAVLKKNADGTYFASTLGRRPAPDVVAGLRKGASYKTFKSGYCDNAKVIGQGSSRMEIKVTVTAATGAFGVVFAASPDNREYTTVLWSPSNNTILVDRSHSSLIKEFANVTVTGYFEPYTLASTGKPEAVTFDIFIDGSLVEIYVNDRFTLTTRIYPSMQCSTGWGQYVQPGSTATFSSIEAWVGLTNAWPERPLNSSAQLVFDTAQQTDNYTWWAGN
ncbi:hypothetical protein AMS68_006361 [Peltaster fructicola]|uniref:Glycosyl hydrolase family 32 N-terminal domain-containing protein n=1 Tax=Peltaster fructicola TaxID=286661 RepID=A0A6H0Y1G2_9PEZI|nr:hypothetical protein AMS68_006361 [Peltaster fructicola]